MTERWINLLTDAEVAALRRIANEQIDYARAIVVARRSSAVERC